MKTASLTTAFIAVALFSGSAAAQQPCPPGALIEAGWTAYRGDRIAAARDAFEAAVRACPRDAGARAGLGYVELREARLTEAAGHFEFVVSINAADIDALLGLGLVAWRQGRLAAADDAFRRVIRIEPDNETARSYLARIPAGFGQPPERPPLQRPDTTVYPARVRDGHFELRSADGWQRTFLKGVNLGAALPGKHPSEFPDSAVYVEWISQMVDMGANNVRVYTIHPPHFYSALRDWNVRNPDRPLWLIHGVWTELPPDDDFTHPQWEQEFFSEMRRVVDLLHGRADILPRPGHASGHYTADVSPWTIAYIIGREWEPYSVVAFNRIAADRTEWSGEYLRVSGTPMDAWLGKACEEMIAYEARTYNAQRPMAYTNWPTLDPLRHATETTVEEEIAIRRGLGEVIGARPLEYDNDATGLDATLVRTTDAFEAGYFASYHAYPYYPDFMVLDPALNEAVGPFGPSNYWGYLERLKQHHGDMAIVISEYGVPASYGSAHLQPQGWHHGGHTEQSMAEVNARMTREIAAADMAGAIIFAWIDEWFKKNWIAIEFEIPLDRNRLWLNRLDAEQHYGMIALEPDYPFPAVGSTAGPASADAGAGPAGSPLAGVRVRAAAWRERPALATADDGTSLRAAADEGYLWLFFEKPDGALPPEVLFGFDIVDRNAGARSWPSFGGAAMGAGNVAPNAAATASATPPTVGIEFALRSTPDTTRLSVIAPYNPFAVVASGERLAGRAVHPPIDHALPGFFAGRWQQRFNRPFSPLATEARAGWEPLLVVTNRRRFGRDSTEYAALGYDRGILPRGPLPDGFWERDDAAGTLEVRIPWMLLNFTDPSQRRVLLDSSGADVNAEFGTTLIDDIGIAVRWRNADGTWHLLDDVRFSWPTWEEPRWRVRTRPVYDAMRTVFNDIR